MTDEELEPKIKMVDSENDFVKSCFEILHLIQDEHSKSYINSALADICEDAGNLVEDARNHALFMMKAIGSARPTFVLYSKAGDGLVAPIILDEMPESQEHRVSIAAPLQIVINMAPVDAYVVFSEAWCAYQDKDSTDTRPPSERPDREEAVIMFAHQPAKTTVCRFKIIRDNDGQATDLVPFEPASDTVNFKARNLLFENFFKTGADINAFLEKMVGENTVH